MIDNRPMKTYKMTTNAIKWKITDDKDTDETCQQIISPSKENEDHHNCSNDESTTLLKNMAEALDVSKRYYEQLKRKTHDQKTMKKKIIGCESLVQYLKKEIKT
jgi:hypothetical protein